MWKLNPMPTMLTVQPTPAAPPRKPPAKRTYQEDEINAFLSQDIIGDFSELNSTHAPPGFQCTKSDNSIVFFNLTYVDGFPVIFESIKVDQSLHVQLQFNGHPVPRPAWFTKGRNATLTRFSQLKTFQTQSELCLKRLSVQDLCSMKCWIFLIIKLKDGLRTHRQ